MKNYYVTLRNVELRKRAHSWDGSDFTAVWVLNKLCIALDRIFAVYVANDSCYLDTHISFPHDYDDIVVTREDYEKVKRDLELLYL